MVGFGSEFAGFLKTLAGLVPTAQIHHSYATLIMIFGAPGVLIGGRLHALLGDPKMRAGTICKFFAGASNYPFELLLGTLKFLLMEQTHSFFIEFHLSLDEWIH